MQKIVLFLFELSTFLLANGDKKAGDTNIARPPIKCFACDGVSSSVDCHRVIECAEDEICYLEKYTDRIDIEVRKYKGGCRNKTLCHTTACLGQAGVNKRAGHVMLDCVKCCDTSFCNHELCGFSKTFNLNNMLRCYNCPNTKDPAHCGDTNICTQNEDCITRTFISVQQASVYYQQMCYSSIECNALMGNTRSRHLIRSNGDIMMSSSCCNGTLCNDYNPSVGKHVTNDIDYDVYDSYLCDPNTTTTLAVTTSTAVVSITNITEPKPTAATAPAAITSKSERTTSKPITTTAITTVSSTSSTSTPVITPMASASTRATSMPAKSTVTTIPGVTITITKPIPPTPTTDKQTTRHKTTNTATTVNLITTMTRFSNMSCYICSGPALLCDSTKAVYHCNSFEQQFCINTVTNVDISTRIVTRGCATGDQCKLYGGLNSPQCQHFNPSKHDSEKYTCTFCCNRPNCNDDVVPANVVQFPVIGKR